MFLFVYLLSRASLSLAVRDCNQVVGEGVVNSPQECTVLCFLSLFLSLSCSLALSLYLSLPPYSFYFLKGEVGFGVGFLAHHLARAPTGEMPCAYRSCCCCAKAANASTRTQCGEPKQTPAPVSRAAKSVEAPALKSPPPYLPTSSQTTLTYTRLTPPHKKREFIKD